MKLTFMLRTVLDKRSVLYRTCATCKYLYLDSLNDCTACLLKVAVLNTHGTLGCPKYTYIRDFKKL